MASFLTMRGAVQNLGDCFPFFYDKVPSYSLISLIGLSSYFYGFKFMMGRQPLTQHPSSTVTPRTPTEERRPGS